MRAMCTPGVPVELSAVPGISGQPELDGAAAVLLALLDRGLSLGVMGGDAADQVGATVAQQTGARRGEIADANWTLVHGPSADAITRAHRGTRLAPERGASLVVAATGEASPVMLTGPGIRGAAKAFVALDEMAIHAFTAANAAPPCGVDLFIVDGDCLMSLPRSVSVRTAAA
jgi:alpha-D-ribose 1-methylphosphonate 5-triphosphate synthase subunit PhnH